MPWRASYHRDQDIVEVSFWGDTSGADVHDATIEAIALVNQYQVRRGLVDCLEQTETGSIVELYDLPELYHSEGLDRSVRIAFVEPARTELKELAEFYETVCLNRGWHVRRFAARENAIDWLLSKAR